MSESLSPGDVLRLRFVREARISPNGMQVAYCVWVTPRGSDADIVGVHLIDLDSGEGRPIAEIGSADFPRWSPDGRILAYVVTVNGISSLVLRNVVDGTLKRFQMAGEAIQGPPSWSADGGSIAVVLDRRVTHNPVCRRIQGRSFRADGLGFIDDYTQRLCLCDVSSGAITTLVDSLGFYSHLDWDEAGERLLFLATRSPVPFAGYSAALYSLNIADGRIEKLLGEEWYLAGVRWLPGSRKIAVVGARGSTLTVPTTDLWVIDLDTQAVDCRSPQMEGRVGFRIHHDMPLWDSIGVNGLEIRGAGSAWVTVQNGGCAQIHEISLAGPLSSQLLATGERSCIVLNASSDGDRLAFLSTDLLTPPEVHVLEGMKERRLTNVNREVLAVWPELSKARFEFRSTDGMSIEGWFLARAGSEGARPTILFIHGGPFGATGHAFRFDLHLLASQGFGVAFANFRGSFGYGESFARAIMGDWGARGYPDHMGALDRVIELGWADPARLGVWGPSHGGFATCWLIGHTDRFRAAVAEAASTNFATTYYLSDAPDTFIRELGGKPHEIPDVYRSRSPLTYAHRCKTPTLFIHGEQDFRCPIGEAEQFHRVLLDVGCVSEIVRLRDASHIADSMGTPEIRVGQNSALLDWFERFL